MKKNKKGFTIVELVIVIGVIAILSAILIPTFVSLTDKAQKAATQSDVRNAYSEYVVKKADEGEAYLGADKVIVLYKAADAKYVYDGNEWKADGEAAVKEGETTPLYFVDLNGNGSADATDILVHTKA